MSSQIVLWEKLKIKNRFILEMKIYRVTVTTKYPMGVRYSLFFSNTQTKDRVLMDNHFPKGPHIHLNDQEIEYK